MRLETSIGTGNVANIDELVSKVAGPYMSGAV